MSKQLKDNQDALYDEEAKRLAEYWQSFETAAREVLAMGETDTWGDGLRNDRDEERYWEEQEEEAKLLAEAEEEHARREAEEARAPKRPRLTTPDEDAELEVKAYLAEEEAKRIAKFNEIIGFEKLINEAGKPHPDMKLVEMKAAEEEKYAEEQAEELEERASDQVLAEICSIFPQIVHVLHDNLRERQRRLLQLVMSFGGNWPHIQVRLTILVYAQEYEDILNSNQNDYDYEESDFFNFRVFNEMWRKRDSIPLIAAGEARDELKSLYSLRDQFFENEFFPRFKINGTDRWSIQFCTNMDNQYKCPSHWDLFPCDCDVTRYRCKYHPEEDCDGECLHQVFWEWSTSRDVCMMCQVLPELPEDSTDESEEVSGDESEEVSGDENEEMNGDENGEVYEEASGDEVCL
jgi:hypothetical protein